jgi:hypothetical protein
VDQREAPKAALEEVTEAAFNGVLQALERRKIELVQFPGPIIIGIIAWPDLRNLPDVLRQPGGQG